MNPVVRQSEPKPDAPTRPSGSDAAPAGASASAPAVMARFELDHFCESCGYNLRSQEVWRDERLGILICRCPECGSHQPANQHVPARRFWVKWWTAVVLILWIGVVVGMHAAAMGLTGATYAATVEVLADHARGWATRGEFFFFLALLGGANALMGFMLALFSAIAFGHWWTRARVLLALAWPSIPFSIFLIAVFFSRDSELSSGAPVIAMWAGVQYVAGAVTAAYGRPLARLTARIFLPPGLRQGLAYLWTSDGLPPPPFEKRSGPRV